MSNKIQFTEYLKDINFEFEKKSLQSDLISFCIELPFIDLVDIYDYLFDAYSFSLFWEETYKTSFIALGKCKNFTLNGPNKFELAKEFHDKTFNNINYLKNNFSNSYISKIIYFFSFSDNSDNRNKVPNMEAVLPSILIVRDKNKVFLIKNVQLCGKLSLKEIVEEFWDLKNQIIFNLSTKQRRFIRNSKISNFELCWHESEENLRYRISQGIQLVDNRNIEKIVLCSKLKVKIYNKFNLIDILKRLRINHPNTCRYVWKRNMNDITFGASPEKLFSFTKNILSLEAIAGTTKTNLNLNDLLQSNKDVSEHKFVINYLMNALRLMGINDFKKDKLKVISFGEIAHLCTSITAKVDKICPFIMLKLLHPSPAVCGFPKDKALNYIERIESFPRDNFASPIGWVGSDGNADFRVAIRGARLLDKEIEFTAGSGLVIGSVCDKEVNEIKLKILSLAKDIFSGNFLNYI